MRSRCDLGWGESHACLESALACWMLPSDATRHGGRERTRSAKARVDGRRTRDDEKVADPKSGEWSPSVERALINQRVSTGERSSSALGIHRRDLESCLPTAAAIEAASDRPQPENQASRASGVGRWMSSDREASRVETHRSSVRGSGPDAFGVARIRSWDRDATWVESHRAQTWNQDSLESCVGESGHAVVMCVRLRGMAGRHGIGPPASRASAE